MVLNINVGILGHVDSGKTSLAKALSTISSTAAFDKSPQSVMRGITLDLGFSCLRLALPHHLQPLTDQQQLQFTLVDCPGHASLIRTIIGGALIIDLALLVVDAQKGFQTQTAECLVISQITQKKILVVINKIDLFEAAVREEKIAKVKKKISTTLANTQFKDSPIVCISANPKTGEPIGLQDLISALAEYSEMPQRDNSLPFLFSFDHCFTIKGQGTVLTGTVLQGSVRVNDTVSIPQLAATKKIKSMQMFHKPVEKLQQGDRAGICVANVDASLLERGYASAVDLVQCSSTALITVQKIQYYRDSIKSKAKFHITCGHDTTTATATFFAGPRCFDVSLEHEYREELEESGSGGTFALLEFDKPVFLVASGLVIGSKLDLDVQNSTKCRLGFWGNVLRVVPDKQAFLHSLKVFKRKEKQGVVDRAAGEGEVIVRGLFKKGSDPRPFQGFLVELSDGRRGEITGTFGQTGKLRVAINRNGREPAEAKKEQIVVKLEFKRLLWSERKVVFQ